MRARHVCVLVALLLALAGSMQAPVSATQTWREASLAAFDEVWQTIADTYHDPSFGGLDWSAVHDELRPDAEAASSPDGVRTVIRQMLARLGQSHFVLMAPSSASGRARGDAGVSIEVRLIDRDIVITKVAPGSAAEVGGLASGQIIRRVNGEAASAWLGLAEGADERQRAVDTLAHAAAALAGAEGSRVTLEVSGPTGGRTIEVERERERGQVVRFGNLPPLTVRVDAFERTTPGRRRAGVVAFNVWMPAASASIDAAVDRFRDAAGLVIDLRGNPGGLVEMIRGVAGHVLDDPVSLGRMRTRQAELEFRANPRRSNPSGRSVVPFSGPVAVLVDELTASASECFAGGLQSLGRVRVFGRQTMGQALPAATRRLVNGDVLMHVLGDFATATGVRLEKRGVVPDVTVPLSIDALRAGRDVALEVALTWIDGQVAVPSRGRLP